VFSAYFVAGLRAGQAEVSKRVFFEKKNQKTFAPLRAVLKRPQTEIPKVFLLLFVHKKKVFLRHARLGGCETFSDA